MYVLDRESWKTRKFRRHLSEDLLNIGLPVEDVAANLWWGMFQARVCQGGESGGGGGALGETNAFDTWSEV